MVEEFKKIVEIVDNIKGLEDNAVVKQGLKEIIATCEELIVATDSQSIVELNKEVSNEAVGHIESNVQEQPKIITDSGICFDKINVIDFVYKPIYKKDYFEGDYIIRFSEERTIDLKMAEALDVHNKFWIQHKTITGSIFGSVPMELLKQESVSTLFARGWIDTKVEIYEILNSDDIKEITDVCKAKFDKYILVKEELTNAFLVLYYL